MATTLTIVARIEATPDNVDLVREELLKLIAPTRAEMGCLQYDLHQDNQDACVFLFYENWESKELWEAHLRSPHIRAYKEATEGSLAKKALNQMSRIG